LAELHARANHLRRNPTEPEKRVWNTLSGSRMGGHKFRRQAVIPPFIADFLCPRAQIDGDTHDGEKDRLRDDLLTSRGYRTIRVSNRDVMSNLEGVAFVIGEALTEMAGHVDSPHPNPSPEGEGLVVSESQSA